MKAVLISIQPKWCEKIANGEKTVEVRKTKPKLAMPFKVYIYRTKGTVKHLCNGKWWNMTVGGNVIGEFVCDKIIDISIEISEPKGLSAYPVPYTGLTDIEILHYLGNGKTGYAWHISDLVIYDEPKELGEFTHEKTSGVWSTKERIKRPPQSWCYVEELEVEHEVQQ